MIQDIITAIEIVQVLLGDLAVLKPTKFEEDFLHGIGRILMSGTDGFSDKQTKMLTAIYARYRVKTLVRPLTQAEKDERKQMRTNPDYRPAKQSDNHYDDMEAPF